MKEKPSPLEKHHKIWRCIGKAIPQSKELKRTIKAPSNIEYLEHQPHVEEHRQTKEVFNFLRHEFKDKKIKETTLYLSDVLQYAQDHERESRRSID